MSMTPREIVHELNRHIIGQDDAKRAVAIALRNRWRHLFEPFFSSESRSSGLGLYICRELCERYGAEIAYQRSMLDQREGNEFFVLMPAAEGQRRPTQQHMAGANSVPPIAPTPRNRPSGPPLSIR